MVPAREEPACPPPWNSEPLDLDGLVDRYTIEGKIPGRVPQTSLFMVLATDRKGERSEVLSTQRFKLFMVTCLLCFTQVKATLCRDHSCNDGKFLHSILRNLIQLQYCLTHKNNKFIPSPRWHTKTSPCPRRNGS